MKSINNLRHVIYANKHICTMHTPFRPKELNENLLVIS